MLPWDNAGAWTSTVMSFIKQGRQVEHQTAVILVSSPSFYNFPESCNNTFVINCLTRTMNSFRLPNCFDSVFKAPNYAILLGLKFKMPPVLLWSPLNLCVMTAFKVVLYISLIDFPGLPCLTD